MLVNLLSIKDRHPLDASHGLALPFVQLDIVFGVRCTTAWVKQILYLLIQDLYQSHSNCVLVRWILILFLFEKVKGILLHKGYNSEIATSSLESMALSTACSSIEED